MRGRAWVRCGVLACAVGLVVNAAVTYALATLVPYATDFHQASREPEAAWRDALADSLPEPAWVSESRNAAITYWQASKEKEQPPEFSRRRPIYVLHLFRVGFPWRCAEGWSMYVDPAVAYAGPKSLWLADVLWRSPRIMKEGRQYLSQMPFKPLWWAMAGNAVVYGLAVAGCAAGVKGAIRARRRWRGLCSRCAYPVAASSVCSECGGAVRTKTVRG